MAQPFRLHDQTALRLWLDAENTTIVAMASIAELRIVRYAELVQSGFILSLEGIHGVGKSAVARLLVDRLRGLGIEFDFCADQTATETGRLVRQVNLNLINKLDSITELFLVASARREAFIHVIRPRLDRGEAILTERFVDSFFAFSLARGTPTELVRTVAHFVADGRKPDLAILLDCPADIALKRIPPEQRHRVERESLDFHEKLRDAYLAVAKDEPARFLILDAELSPEQLVEAALPSIVSRLKKSVQL